ncbi:MAG: ATP-binding protein [Proteobacteria bacterium]|nr:ATP-binding protein [Pseudomonadota bacterium]
MIKLPDLFKEKLKNATELNANILLTFERFEPWLEQSGMPFFPGFTDHSPRHVNDVLNTAASLISDESHELLTAQDVAVLCMAVLIHDCGMHLTQDGFRALINESKKPLILGMNDQPWSSLWNGFIAEARRFGQDKLMAIFGDTDPILIDEINYDNFSERDSLLIGEFIRRHHARLAHEIAVAGVPSRNPKRLELTGFDKDLKNLAGLVARSHGLPIRCTFTYLRDQYGLLPEQHDVKSPYLMAVLRIADYIQVRSERALNSLLSVKELRSPISRQAWRDHFAVKGVSSSHDDPEVFFVSATPTEVKTYLRLVALFKDIQRELDESWATIGEVYGRRGSFARLGLTIRRIRSNLDSPETFSQTVPYIPIKASFDTSGPDLLKLLVGPLYDYKYEVGIRELIQNAVDACRELCDYSNNSADSNRSSNEEPDVLVTIQENEDGTGWITVTDKGVGMTLETVTEYFLIAGASFRNSELWKRQHMDEFGQSRVMRGGRFGIGALASFMLGDEIEVKTRHFLKPDNEGLEFKARIDESSIELRRCVCPEAGTSIKLWVSDPDIINELRPYSLRYIEKTKDVILLDSWNQVDWFIQASPRVEYRWEGKVFAKFISDKANHAPLSGTSDSSWNRLTKTEPYKDIYWRYAAAAVKVKTSTWTIVRSDEVSVNGIRIGRAYFDQPSILNIPDKNIGTGPKFTIKRPSLAIFDPNGTCPINLQRSVIAFDRMNIDLTIAKDVVEKHLSCLIKKAQSISTLVDFYQLSIDLIDSYDINYKGLTSPICATSNGIFLAAPSVFNELKITTLFLANSSIKTIYNTKLAEILQEGEAIIFRKTANGLQNDLAWFRSILSRDQYYNNDIVQLQNRASLSIMPIEKWQSANEKRAVKKDIIRNLTVIPKDTSKMVAISGNNQLAHTMLSRCDDILDILGGSSEIGGWSLLPSQNDQPDTDTLLNNAWLKITSGSFLVKFQK